MPANEIDLIDTKEASELLGKSTKTVARRVLAGELNYVKKFPGVRGAYVFDRKDVIALKARLGISAPVRRRPSPDDTSSTGAFVVSEGDDK